MTEFDSSSIFKRFIEHEIPPTHEGVAEKLMRIVFAIFVDFFRGIGGSNDYFLRSWRHGSCEFRLRFVSNKIAGKRKRQPARILFMLHFFMGAIKFLRDGIPLDPGEHLFGDLIQEYFFVLPERIAFVGVASSAEKVAVFARQAQLLLSRSLHLTFPNLNSSRAFPKISFEKLTLENDRVCAVNLADHTSARHFR